MKKILTLLSIALAALTSCKPEEELVQYSLSIDPIELSFNSAGGEGTVTVTSSAAWNLWDYYDWCYASSNYGDGNAEIVFTVQPNENTTSSRTATFTFVSGDKEATLTVTQGKKEFSISIEPTELTFGAEGGEQEIVITSSDEWEVTEGYDYYSWFDVSKVSGTNGDTVRFSVEPYYDRNEARTNVIVFSTGNKEVELKVTQQIDDSPIIQFKDPRFLSAIEDSYWNASANDNYGRPLFGNDAFSFSWYLDLDRSQFDFEFDKNDDGEISENEAVHGTGLQLTKLYSNSDPYNIRDMGEIKYFASLEYLDCSRSQLTSLDLSNNTALTYLNCSDNDLTTLDLSNCTALIGLDCESNQLTTLDLSNNTALEYLFCSWNWALTSLDVSNSTALTYLDCSDNNLTTLDLSNNTALTELYCSSNQLASLDLSNNTALTELNCYDNQLTSLDLSNNTALTHLNCSNNPQLFKIILPKFYKLADSYIRDIIEEYGDIIEYVE